MAYLIILAIVLVLVLLRIRRLARLVVVVFALGAIFLFAAAGIYVIHSARKTNYFPGPITNFNERADSCGSIKGSSNSSGAPVEIGTCSGKTQNWRVRATTKVHGFFGYQFENGVNLCLGVVGNAQVVQETCSSTSDHSQIWWPTYSSNGNLYGYRSDPGDGTYWLWNARGGRMCLDAQDSSAVTSVGALVIQDRCDSNSLSQRWDI